MTQTHAKTLKAWMGASGMIMAAMLALTACAQQPDPLPTWPTPKVSSDEELPIGSVIEKIGTDTHATDAGSTDTGSTSTGSTDTGSTDTGSTTNTNTTNTNTEPPFGSLRPDTATSEERVPQIHQRGRLIVGVAQSLNRLGYRDPETGDLAGFEVDLGREIARDIFGDPDKVEFRFVDSIDRVKALTSGDVDVVIRTLTITKERQAQIEYSAPYLHVTNRMLVLKDSDVESFADLKGKRVCVARSSTSADMVKEYAPAELLRTNTWTDCLMAMQRHQADAIFTDDAILSGLHSQDPYTRIIDEYSGGSDYGVGIAPPTKDKDTRGLTMQVNTTLQRIAQDGTWTALYNNWLADYLGTGKPPSPNYRTPQEDQQMDEHRRANGYQGRQQL